MPNCNRDRSRDFKAYWWLFVFLFTICLPYMRPLHTVAAEVTLAQRRELNTVKNLLRRAKQLEQKGQLEPASKMGQQVHDRLTKLLTKADAALRRQSERPFQDFVKLHTSLEFAGITMAPYQQLDRLVHGTAPSVPFTTKVAPILLSKCGRCHVNQQRGGVAMTTFATLMQGPAAGRIVLPGDADGSRLIEVIESGDMPRGGAKVTGPELQTLKQWIGAGAEFDGEDPQASLANLSSAAKKVSPAKVQVANATGNETVSFAHDLAGILNERCANCHGNDRPVRARLNLTTFEGLLRGGDNGPPVAPGKPDESLLLQKLKGTAEGARMPQGGKPLADDVIAQFETWIREGARFDGPDPKQHVRELAAITHAQFATHEELRKDRKGLAMKNWNLIMPDVRPTTNVTEHFLLVSNIDSRMLNEYALAAERLVPRIAKALRVPTGQPLVKGAMTLYFFKSSYDYGEMGRMVEKRDLNPAANAHFRFSIVDAYAAFNMLPATADSLDTIMAQQIAGLYVASLGKTPAWFRQGTARAVAARLTPRSDLVVQWSRQFDETFPRMEKHDDFIAGRSPATDADLLAYGFTRFLMSDSRRFLKLTNQLREGGEFVAAFRNSYGATPEQVAKTWTRREANNIQRRSRRKR